MLVHGDELGRSDGPAPLVLGAKRLDRIGRAAQYDMQVGIFGERCGNTVEHNAGRMVSAQRIDR